MDDEVPSVEYILRVDIFMPASPPKKEGWAKFIDSKNVFYRRHFVIHIGLKNIILNDSQNGRLGKIYFADKQKARKTKTNFTPLNFQTLVQQSLFD